MNVDPRIRKFAFAYLDMAQRARYRPCAPGDGCGGIYLSAEELRDRMRLRIEALTYAIQFLREEDGDSFVIGCSNYATSAAFVFAIEAARLLASGDDGNETAPRLLRMAIEEIVKARKARAA
jgi:hypothetical protein